MTKIKVYYADRKTKVTYSVEETSIQMEDYLLRNNCIEFDAAEGSTIVIPFNNVLSIKIYKEEKHDKEKRKEPTEETDRELLRKTF